MLVAGRFTLPSSDHREMAPQAMLASLEPEKNSDDFTETESYEIMISTPQKRNVVNIDQLKLNDLERIYIHNVYIEGVKYGYIFKTQQYLPSGDAIFMKDISLTGADLSTPSYIGTGKIDETLADQSGEVVLGTSSKIQARTNIEQSERMIETSKPTQQQPTQQPTQQSTQPTQQSTQPTQQPTQQQPTPQPTQQQPTPQQPTSTPTQSTQPTPTQQTKIQKFVKGTTNIKNGTGQECKIRVRFPHRGMEIVKYSPDARVVNNYIEFQITIPDAIESTFIFEVVMTR